MSFRGFVASLSCVANSYQGSAKRVLCVCSVGMLRSPTLAEILIAEYGYNCRAVGSSELALISINQSLISWAHELVFIGMSNFKRTSEKFCLEDKIIKVLNVPDEYAFRDPELIKLLRKAYEETDCVRLDDDESGC